ncbi:type II secretion system F family protein [Saxibacter everestensis]|uniref:Type II secretion system F family protein n=1 Tax=Saxibacter everestensis TaxID=2909229 RepID=A0ABY8QQ67_9MICO|nr:type II secretion system F family protein [Brevibacteriaceae bacterium ZFBP1038]
MSMFFGGLIAVAVWLWQAGSSTERLRRLLRPPGTSAGYGRSGSWPHPCGSSAPGIGFGRNAIRFRISRNRQAHAADAALRAIDTVAELAALLRAGVSAETALRQLAHVHKNEEGSVVLVAAARAAELGDSVDVALAASSTQRSTAEQRVFRGMGLAWRVANECGAPLADVLDRFAASARSDVDARMAREAALAGPRSTVTVLTWLPVGGLFVGALVGTDPIDTLLEPGAGTACLSAGLVLLLAGKMWMSRLMRTVT